MAVTVLAATVLDGCVSDYVGDIAVYRYPCGLEIPERYIPQRQFTPSEERLLRAAHQRHHDEGHWVGPWAFTVRYGEGRRRNRVVEAWCACRRSSH